MYVIKGDIATKTAGLLYPAELCVFATADKNQYEVEVTEAKLLDPVTTAEVVIANPVLGFINKTGRFVAITK